MFAAFVTSFLPRLIPVGMILLALQKTLFLELQPFGVIIQLVTAFAAAAGAVGGPERGAVAGFVLGLMFDLAVGSPLGSSSIAFGVAGWLAGWVDMLRVETTWWLAAIFVGVGAGAGEAMVPVVRRFVGETDAFAPELALVLPVVAVSAALLSPVLVPLGRWSLKIERSEWKAPPVD